MIIDLIIDCSLYWYKCMFRLKSPGFNARSTSELIEFGREFASEMLKLKKRFNPSDFVLGLDSREWRTPYFNKWFTSRVHFWSERRVKDSWVMQVIDKTYIVTKNEKTGVWASKKATAAEKLVLDITNAERWVFFKAGETPQEMLDIHPNAPKNVREAKAWEGLKMHYPQYKGGRNLDWPFNTSYKDFKKHARALTKNLAGVLGARFVEAEWCEFDDFARAYVVKHNNEESANTAIICTSDQDMDQLIAKNMFTKIWNPGSGLYNPERWVEYTPEQATFHLFCKLIGGDSSDRIPPTTFWEETGKKVKKTTHTTYPVVSWESGSKCKKGEKTVKFCARLIEEFGSMKKAWPYLLEHQIDGTFSRNVKMMHLDAAPKEVKSFCQHSLETQVVLPSEYTLTDFGLTKVDEMTIADHARILAEMDHDFIG